MIMDPQHKLMADPAPDLKRKYNSQKELSDNTKNSALDTKEKKSDSIDRLQLLLN